VTIPREAPITAVAPEAAGHRRKLDEGGVALHNLETSRVQLLVDDLDREARHRRRVRRSRMEIEVTRWLRCDTSINGFNLGAQPQGIEIHWTRNCHRILALVCVQAVRRRRVSSIRTPTITPDTRVMPAITHIAAFNPNASLPAG